jgi:hypothetical protein
MLSFETPPIEIDGIVVFRDHAVSNQFYYAAPPPRISRAGAQLMFDLFAYTVDLKHSPLSGTTIPDELGAGFLTMGVDCGLADSRRLALVRGLADRTQIPEEQIALAPIPYHKGSISVLALDKFSAPGGALGQAGSEQRLAGRPTFVREIIGSATPALLGDLRAIFSLSLSQDGVTFLQGLYEDLAAPIGVVYDLRFYGLRPAVQARITANLRRVYEHFGGGVGGQYGWFKADISAGVDHLEEQGDITIEITSQATGDEAQKSKELALSLFKDRIVQEMFRPIVAIPPNLLNSGSRDLSSALKDAAGKTSIGFTLNITSATELKTVTYDFSERAPEERTHAPQGFLQTLLDPAEVRQRIHQIDLHNDFFELLEVLVAGPTLEEFAALNIRQVEATLTYGTPDDGLPPESQSLLFRADSTGDKLFAVKRRGRTSLAYTCGLTYEFSHAAGVDVDTFRYEIAPQIQTSRAPRINPYDNFGVLNVELEPGRIHPDVREVNVLLSYRSPDARLTAEEHIRLALDDQSSGAARPRWQVRTQEIELSPYAASYTFVFRDGAVYQAPPLQSTEPLLSVDSPFAGDRRLRITPNVTSPQINQMLVEIEYADEPHSYARRFQVSLDAPFTGHDLSWPILDMNQQRIRYRVTTFEPGFVNEGDWQTTDDPSIVAGAVGSRMATVQIRLVGPTLAQAGLDALQLRLELLAANATESDTHSFLFDGTQTSQDVKFALPPGETLRYRYQTTAFKADGQVIDSAWKEMTSSMLIISTRTV